MNQPNQLTQHFATASYYSIALPNSYQMPRILESVSLEQIQEHANRTQRDVYDVFVGKFRDCVRSFLERNGEIPDVMVDTVKTFPGNLTESDLILAVTEMGISRLMSSLDEVLANMRLQPDILKAGHSWKCLPCNKMTSGIEFGRF